MTNNDKTKSLIKEIEKITKTKVIDYKYEKIDEEMTVLGIKLKNYPNDINKVSYSVEVMNKLNNKLPDNIDIFFV